MMIMCKAPQTVKLNELLCTKISVRMAPFMCDAALSMLDSTVLQTGCLGHGRAHQDRHNANSIHGRLDGGKPKPLLALPAGGAVCAAQASATARWGGG